VLKKYQVLPEPCNTKEKNPVIKLNKGKYEMGINLIQKARKQLEEMIVRITGIEKWAVDIPCYANS
jgi:hypothetical protein